MKNDYLRFAPGWWIVLICNVNWYSFIYVAWNSATDVPKWGRLPKLIPPSFVLSSAEFQYDLFLGLFLYARVRRIENSQSKKTPKK